MMPAAAYGQSAPPSDPPLPAMALGTTTFLDAEGGPGTLVHWNSTAYVANRVNDGSGNAAPVDFRTDSQGAVLHVAHTSKMKFLGAYVGAEVLLPIAHVRVRSGQLSESTTGIGDPILGAVLQWTGKKLLGKPFAARLDLNVAVPIGSYDRDNLVNIGNKAWSISPYLALTWQPVDRFEISSRITYNWMSKSTAPPYATKLANWQAGEQLAINLSGSYELSKTWRIGIGGYTLQQVSDSKAEDQRILGARQRVWGVGPGVRWSHGNQMLILTAYKEFAAENRPEGYQGGLRMIALF
ncbi:hypothetical protein F4V91_02240 [Neorhizobium galegae]|uniref:Transporter n=1 Tax=Neorhizobium galegae TaxID=399 RepID=A0A6A1TM35_NEOGA|nr:transporter [Neorhizobium galegae]KAB1085358.1 hypothetical protein F4V91_02240 [Neorhizobium galegae]